MQRVLNSLASRVDPSIHPLLMEREQGADAKVLLVVVTADKGLCGGFNTNIIKAASAFINSDPARPALTLGLVGRKGRDFFRRRGFEIGFEEIGVFQRVQYADAKRIADAVIEDIHERPRQQGLHRLQRVQVGDAAAGRHRAAAADSDVRGLRRV